MERHNSPESHSAASPDPPVPPARKGRVLVRLLGRAAVTEAHGRARSRSPERRPSDSNASHRLNMDILAGQNAPEILNLYSRGVSDLSSLPPEIAATALDRIAACPDGERYLCDKRMEILVNHIDKLGPFFAPRQLAKISCACATVGLVSPSMDTMLECVADRIHEFGSSDASLTVQSTMRVDMEDSMVVHDIKEETSLGRRDRFSSDLYKMAQHFGKLRYNQPSSIGAIPEGRYG
eukprot:gnl/MRDRNA2_/MRDRNA2_86600_c0_seq2.p1 gnl/MRDRNA2_/MRDRNA2_86600_c0~~gnl/MRDRNA2_/MRDRNA2_86600_c0_seq2.p1  ORF type:complete len:236 (-),score=32.49 gnl/MRDRNA2_/MRDRNA2_86600_c0_seq2:319-1026(-)